MTLDITQILLLLPVCLGAGFIQRVTGFGLGIFVMLFLPHFMPSHMAAVTISCLFSCGTSTYNAVRYRKDVPFKTILPLVVAALITIPVAVHFSAKVSGEFFNIFFGIVLIFLSVYFLFFDNRITMRPSIRNGLIAGGLGGTLNGLFSTGGPPVVLYLTHAAENNIAYFAGIQFYFCLTNIYATVFRFINGAVTGELLVYALIGFAACILGDFFGKMVFDKLNAKKLKTLIYLGMIISGIIMIL